MVVDQNSAVYHDADDTNPQTDVSVLWTTADEVLKLHREVRNNEPVARFHSWKTGGSGGGLVTICKRWKNSERPVAVRAAPKPVGVSSDKITEHEHLVQNIASFTSPSQPL